MTECTELKAGFCFPVQSFWHSPSLYFQLGWAPSEGQECGHSLSKSQFSLGSAAWLTTPKSQGGGVPWEQPEAAHREAQQALGLGWAHSSTSPCPETPGEGSVPWEVPCGATSVPRDVIWRGQSEAAEALGIGIWRGRLMCPGARKCL